MRFARQTLFALLALAALTGPFVAEAQTAAPKRGGTVRLVEPGEPDSLDMARTLANYSFIVGEQIFEGLFRWTPKGLVPWLAQDVRVSPDGKSVTLKLRQGVVFHDGTPFNAEAVKFNLERIRDGKGFTYAGLLTPLTEIKAADEHTVQITMKAPYGPLRALLGFIYFGMQSPTALQKHGENSGSNPVGTGPFKFQSWQRGGELVLVRNDAYWGDKAFVDRIVVTAIPDLNGRVSALEAGDADVIVEVPPSEVARLSKSNRVQVLSAVTSRNQWLRFNELKPPFEKPQVRRAAALATNRDAYIKGVMQGHATRARNIVGPGVVGYAELGPDPVRSGEGQGAAGPGRPAERLQHHDDLRAERRADLPGGRAGPRGGGHQREAPDARVGHVPEVHHDAGRGERVPDVHRDAHLAVPRRRLPPLSRLPLGQLAAEGRQPPLLQEPRRGPIPRRDACRDRRRRSARPCSRAP